MVVALLLGLIAADDAKLLANKADVLKYGLSGVQAVAVHEVTDTSGKVEKQIYTVLNHVQSGNSFIVISSESSEVNGMVFLIKGSTLFAAAPNQRTFMRLGGMNLDRRIAGSLFSHWDLQGNIPVGDEYDAKLAKKDANEATLELVGKAGSHYKKIEAVLDLKSGLFKENKISDDKGLMKIVRYSKPRTMGTTLKRKIQTLAEMTRADGRSDLPVPKTVFRVYEVEFNPAVNYEEVMAATDSNLQRLRSKYVISGDRYRSILAEAAD
jgi:hypothetical protein